MTDFRGLIEALCKSEVKFVIVGGVAATLHGSARLTQDVDVVYARDPENLVRVARALAPLRPYLRGAPPGDIDLLGEITGVGDYEALRSHSVEVRLYGARCRCIDLATLIAAKLAVGRPKDLEVIAELRALLDEGSRKR